MEQPLQSQTYSGSHGAFEHNEAHLSGVSWSAVFVGDFATAALALVLLALGAGLGLSSVSPWSNTGASGSTLGKASIIWLIVMEMMSSAMGGYLAGRLRTKWASIHSDEVYFRDTAHGFLAWCVALVITAAFLTSAATTLVGSSASGEHQSATSANHESATDSYFVDSLFRSDAAKTESASTAVREESGLIFAKGLRTGELAPADRSYLSQLVAAKTGMSAADSDSRVSSVLADAQRAADTTRKATAYALLWTFVALLIGAFCASFAATLGGRQRDHVVTI